jgi:hypothetical protein
MARRRLQGSVVRPATVLAVILVLATAARAGAPAPRCEVPELRYDAQTVNQGTVIRHTFLVKNTGTSNLTIHAKPG